MRDIVKKLKQWSLSAGNIICICNSSSAMKYGTSETLCNETVAKAIIENIKEISVHVPRHFKPQNLDQFGHYLAGLIDGNGIFNNKQQLTIEFHPLDASLAYYIKKRIGYGSVKKLKTREAILYNLSSSEGLIKTINLINGKIRSKNTLNQIITNVLSNSKFSEIQNQNNLNIKLDNDFNNHWLAGFSDARASLHINFVNFNSLKFEIQLNFKLSQINDNSLLLLIKNLLGGNLNYIKDHNTYYYDSSSFGSAKKVIDYLDHYHLLSTKQVNYLKWRKSYILIQSNNYLSKIGLDRITKYKNTMNR